MGQFPLQQTGVQVQNAINKVSDNTTDITQAQSDITGLRTDVDKKVEKGSGYTVSENAIIVMDSSGKAKSGGKTIADIDNVITEICVNGVPQTINNKSVNLQPRYSDNDGRPIITLNIDNTTTIGALIEAIPSMDYNVGSSSLVQFITVTSVSQYQPRVLTLLEVKAGSQPGASNQLYITQYRSDCTITYHYSLENHNTLLSNPESNLDFSTAYFNFVAGNYYTQYRSAGPQLQHDVRNGLPVVVMDYMRGPGVTFTFNEQTGELTLIVDELSSIPNNNS